MPPKGAELVSRFLSAFPLFPGRGGVPDTLVGTTGLTFVEDEHGSGTVWILIVLL
jgi:hypothetical protein